MKARFFICTADNKYIHRYVKRPDGVHWEFCGRDQADLFLESEVNQVAIECLGPGARYRTPEPTIQEFLSWSGRNAGRAKSAKKAFQSRRNGMRPKVRTSNLLPTPKPPTQP